MTTTILAVEDDEDLRALLCFILEAQGDAVATAENGLEALALVHERMPDLILLDVRMPVMSGSEFAAEYHARYGQGPRAPIIVMTAAEHASRRSAEIGANDFLAKPFSYEELVAVVKRHVEESRSPPATGA
jgi:CheY-like chemotaxis protein